MILRSALRAALASTVVTITLYGSAGIVAAQQLAAYNDEPTIDEQAAQDPSSDEPAPSDAYARQIVPFHTSEKPGTVIVDTGERYLYLVQPNETAIRYGIGVGRVGFQWSGVERVSKKQEWPDWRVPAEMIGRQPYLPRFMAGGPGNPLGARALYLGHTEFRIHGTNQPDTIGHAVSSGCFRLDNADVIDLYNRVEVGAKVVVKQTTTASNKHSSGA
jgi:lipoprotein-anchoring transpeptidase ErfK/SrfK